jgi:hypothetical protein
MACRGLRQTTGFFAALRMTVFVDFAVLLRQLAAVLTSPYTKQSVLDY